MSILAVSDPARPLSEKQKAALIQLLADEDSAVHQQIRTKILSFGHEALEWLRPHALSGDPVLRRRVQEVVRYLARQDADNEFLGFCLSQGEDLDLEEGSWLLSKSQFPDINTSGYQALFDAYAADIRPRLEFLTHPEKIIATINQYLFADLGFSGNEQNYYDPENSYLNRVVDRRTGNPISLCIIYLLLTRRLRLPVAGIGMPGHFLVRYQSSTGEVFIDAFNRGKLLTKADCIKYLLQTSHGFQESYLSPISPRRVLLRACTNLHQIYVQNDSAEETARLQRYIVALAK